MNPKVCNANFGPRLVLPIPRSLRKLRGMRSTEDVDADFARLRAAYTVAWDRGY